MVGMLFLDLKSTVCALIFHGGVLSEEESIECMGLVDDLSRVVILMTLKGSVRYLQGAPAPTIIVHVTGFWPGPAPSWGDTV